MVSLARTPLRFTCHAHGGDGPCNASGPTDFLRVGLAACIASGLLLGASDPSAASVGKLTPEERTTIDIFKRSTPSVVSVTNLAVQRDAFTLNAIEVPQGVGSGFIWDKEGHIVTNYHVINQSANVRVTLGQDKAEYMAKVVGVDPDKDIAVLQVVGLSDGLATLGPVPTSGPAPAGGPITVAPPLPATTVPPAIANQLQPLCVEPSVDGLQVGQRVYAIGNPFGLDFTLTTGVVSGTEREIQSLTGRPIQGVIQTDAAINPGNSGGPLLDSSGCVIGINTAIFSPSGSSSGIGFAIPSDTIKSSVGSILQYGRVVRPILGISFAPEQAVETLGVKGIMVLSARDGGPAAKAGVQGTTRDEYGRLVLGDIIRAVNGSPIKNSSDLYKILDKAKVGETLDVEILRGSSTQHLAVTLEANDL
eukprot:CAMPEP_0202863164 /NCGR_PEP_ID=MMETSP1391-20130828/3905_1 /ASSEMBLY_ACC=CAM_ASM_000867 /TAXON_ID=1034604 /ORGANISM="Chlamydomonas leiostraca, Strain SAG 11-49" /LENGTH=419 /DNA_ID=CAMNT_0049542769 /DNA_START=150 /DNA_END=1409 /DNA_ORIENTATION=+